MVANTLDRKKERHLVYLMVA